jgi:hypothetical protein
LVIHKDTRPVTRYVLSVGKGGSKLRPAGGSGVGHGSNQARRAVESVNRKPDDNPAGIATALSVTPVRFEAPSIKLANPDKQGMSDSSTPAITKGEQTAHYAR